MTDKTDPIREIHEYVTTHGGENTATHLLVQAASVIQTQAAELEAVGAGGGQALSAAPEAIAKLRHLYQNMVNGAVRDTASAKRIAEGLLAPAIEALERATPPAEQQAALKAAPGKRLTREQIREVFMANGFTVKEGQTDLKQYVYDAAHALLGLVVAPQQEAQEPTTIDQKTMELAESVGLIGPASRIGDLHAAIQRFHDLICVNATIKAAVMAADAISGVATPARDYPPLPMQFACSGVFPVYSADQMRAYVDADRAAYASGSSQPAPAPLSDDTERLNWLLWKLPGDALRYVVGELADTSSGAEFRAAIDAAIAAQGGKA